jgi:hypothetical protein
MVIVMDMNTGITEKPSDDDVAAEEFGPFVDEVLNAGWLPRPEARLELHEPVAKPVAAAVDVDEFLRTLYRNQE